MNSFPLLLPTNLNNDHYSGYITINGKEYFIDIKIDKLNERNNNNLSKFKLYFELELDNLIKDYKEGIIKKLDWFSDLESLLNYIKNLIEEKNNININNKQSNLDLNWFNNNSIFQSIILELQKFNKNCIKSINSQFTSYELTIQDSFSRDHDIILKLDYDYPQIPPSIELQIPNNSNYIMSKSQFNLLTKSNNLITDCLNICVKELDKFNSFWEVIEDLNSNCLIIDPNPIKRWNTGVRISLGNMCYLELTINPNIPRSIPNYRLLGSEVKLKSIKDRILNNINNWNSNELPSYNFKNNWKLPEVFKNINNEQSTQNSSQLELDCCCICLEYKIQQNSKLELPTFTCNNTQCNAIYHHSCLISWIKSLPGSRKSFKKWFGKCCNCEYEVSIIEH